jgi:hypothetical protein
MTQRGDFLGDDLLLPQHSADQQSQPDQGSER